ncbi:IclR family transcriptional regulator [Nocardioides albertanoniae]|uniref:IclR family transcriptional regulator n=1 Tax=Nocardioides albertanoniae TaxID=1175486 RepID=A0A543A300_9ACTN|nr:IclR family transcriptional regulator C-terminal domain-containing protein [Nocardioides albertanoniae]TQL66963.1 IclR family transcriptional regulator [Nocardioides albertanoniae]
MTSTPASSETVTSLLRGLDVLGILSRADHPVSLAEVARLADTTRATARRLLLTLEKLGYVATDGPTYWLRPKVMELGDLYLAGLGLPEVAHPHLAALAARVHDTCSLTVLDGDSVVYVDRVKASRMMTVNIAVGTRLPAFAMSSGRVLLADLGEQDLQRFLDGLHGEPITGHTRTSPAEVARLVARARADGYAITDQELDPALRSLAAPVRGPDGHTVAAVNVAVHVTRTSVQQLRDDVLPELLVTTRAIEADLAAAPQLSAG